MKWPNDVLLDGRKLAGVLVEARPDERLGGAGDRASTSPSSSPSCRPTCAPARRRSAARRRRWRRRSTSCSAHLERRLAEPPADCLAALRARDALRDRPIRWSGGEGTGAGIDDAGALLVRLADGTVRTLDAGEVHLGSVCDLTSLSDANSQRTGPAAS